MRSMFESYKARFISYLKSEQSILRDLCKERERNAFLQSELSQRDRLQSPARSRSSVHESMDFAEAGGEQYIQELETLLQESRAQLLQTKLQLSDYQVESLGYRNQLDA